MLKLQSCLSCLSISHHSTELDSEQCTFFTTQTRPRSGISCHTQLMIRPAKRSLEKCGLITFLPNIILIPTYSGKSHSTPGLESFSIPYYDHFTTTLETYSARFFNELRKGTLLDKSLNLAFISVIPKPSKDPSLVANYRFISLINNNLKILKKILADRIYAFIGLYDHKHQVGFIPGRQGPDQIRRAIKIICLLNSQWDGGPPQTGFLLSLDLQKAFYAWLFLMHILKSWVFGNILMNVIGALYSNPEAKTHLQGYYSESLPIFKGTRQGWPLSPLIFAIVIKTLAISIRDQPDKHRE